MIVVVSIGVHCLEETFAIKPPEWAIKSYMNVRVVNGVPPEGDYAFDKCNKYSCDIFSNFSRGAEEPDLPITAGAGANNSEKAMATGDITSASNPSAVPATSALMADNASILASLRTVCSPLRCRRLLGTKEVDFGSMLYLAIRVNAIYHASTLLFGQRIAGDRLGECNQKMKVPGRTSEGAPSPAHKRPRKLKSSDP
ncbi:hypothetical protein CDL15_Pgr010013 [Punica granatum]|uniref:Uncharacterized protein n=1 Tax=Punica granatum TaxID=22663 RepID=A0A218X482_PUNGR|nr:hypothetical protein CDL15_Pgr010013 [Punica granatum]